MTSNPAVPASTATPASLAGTAEAPEEAPRVIDENTDMSTLTDQEIMKLMEGMDHQDVQLDKVIPPFQGCGCASPSTDLQPLISSPVPLLVLREEYQNGSPEVLKKIDWLEQNGWDQVWRARGDGDCFYRCELLLPVRPRSSMW